MTASSAATSLGPSTSTTTPRVVPTRPPSQPAAHRANGFHVVPRDDLAGRPRSQGRSAPSTGTGVARGGRATYSGEVAPSRDRGPLRPQAPTVPLPSARLRVLRAVARHEPATTAELSRALGGHENTTRQHLEALTRDELVQGEQNRGGMGRPSVSYSLSPTGLVQLASRSSSPEHTALVATLADHLVDTTDDPAAQARAVGLAWGTRLAADADHLRARDGGPAVADAGRRGRHRRRRTDAVAEAVELLDALGFSPPRRRRPHAPPRRRPGGRRPPPADLPPARRRPGPSGGRLPGPRGPRRGLPAGARAATPTSPSSPSPPAWAAAPSSAQLTRAPQRPLARAGLNPARRPPCRPRPGAACGAVDGADGWGPRRGGRGAACRRRRRGRCSARGR